MTEPVELVQKSMGSFSGEAAFESIGPLLAENLIWSPFHRSSGAKACPQSLQENPLIDVYLE